MDKTKFNNLFKSYRRHVSQADIQKAVDIGKKETAPTRRKIAKMMWD